MVPYRYGTLYVLRRAVVGFENHTRVALTLATLVFFASGSAYSRAWCNCGDAPNPRHNRYGDILSGVGAVILGCGLVMLGGALVAIIAGVLNAAGKFGSAFAGSRTVQTCRETIALTDLCKDVVLVGRFPAMWAALVGLLAAIDGAQGVAAIVLAISLMTSTIFWGMADALLLRRNGPLMTMTLRLLSRDLRSGAH